MGMLLGGWAWCGGELLEVFLLLNGFTQGKLLIGVFMLLGMGVMVWGIVGVGGTFV